jgi:nitrite reductase/ring-hydroxylating ferredoxin subunit
VPTSAHRCARPARRRSTPSTPGLTPTVACPWHLWEWDLESGEHAASGQRIGTFDTAVDDGDVYVRI